MNYILVNLREEMGFPSKFLNSDTLMSSKVKDTGDHLQSLEILEQEGGTHL